MGWLGRGIRRSKHLAHSRYSQVVEVISKIGHPCRLCLVQCQPPPLWPGEAANALEWQRKERGYHQVGCMAGRDFEQVMAVRDQQITGVSETTGVTLRHQRTNT